MVPQSKPEHQAGGDNPTSQIAISGDNPTSQIAIIRTDLERMAPQFQYALPEHIPVHRFIRVVMTAIQSDPKLLACTRASIFSSATQAAQDGLLPDGRDGAIVAFWSAKQGTSQATWMPMYQGVLKKVRNSGELKTISAHVVYDQDDFFYSLGDEEHIKHSPCLDTERGQPRLVYAIAHTKDGGIFRELMTLAEIEKVRGVSKAKNGAPWTQWWDEMAKKTVIRRLAKRLPMSSEFNQMIEREDGHYDFGTMLPNPKATTSTPIPSSSAPMSLEAFATPASLEDGQ